MTRTQKTFVWTLSTFLTLLAVLVLIIVFFDWNRIKPPLTAKVSEELHRAFLLATQPSNRILESSTRKKDASLIRGDGTP